MRTYQSLTVTVIALSVALAAYAADGKETPAESKLPACFVMGEPLDFNIKVVTDDGPVYFCCRPCTRKFKSDPEKYAALVKEQREALAKVERVQVTCPVNGDPIDPKVSSRHGDQTVYFCNAQCQAEYDKEPARYAAKLLDCYTYQTKCPIGDEKIDPTAFADLPTGERIYLCCKPCAEKLLADPAKYAEKLSAQGIHLNLRRLQKK
jgi:YHS domain-containing protein